MVMPDSVVSPVNFAVDSIKARLLTLENIISLVSKRNGAELIDFVVVGREGEARATLGGPNGI